MGSVDPPTTAPQLSEKAPQLLATEHWSLLATRSMLWNEAFSRTAVFLNVLSASAVALALVADATEFGQGFGMFAIVLFPLVLFLGFATFARLLEVNVEDIQHMAAMNRLRRAYLDLDPSMERYLSAGTSDDLPGLVQTFTMGGWSPRPWLQSLITTPTVIATVDAIIAAAGAALIAGPRTSRGVTVILSVLTFLLVWGGLYAVQVRVMVEVRQLRNARFPSAGQ